MVLSPMGTAERHTRLPQEQRRLAAIMFTDIVDYTAFTQRNESQALRWLEKHNAIMRSFFPRYGGKEIKTIGDSFLVQFDSALDASTCAVEIQKFLHDYDIDNRSDWKLRLRIGIHLGDVVFKGDDVFGDTVNIASRIEPVAAPEGVCISQQVYDQISNKVGHSLLEVQRPELKNVNPMMRIYKILMPWETKPAALQQVQERRHISNRRVAVVANEDGPLLVLVDGIVFAALCRCGASKKQPYCDGAHRTIAFTAAP